SSTATTPPASACLTTLPTLLFRQAAPLCRRQYPSTLLRLSSQRLFLRQSATPRLLSPLPSPSSSPLSSPPSKLLLPSPLPQLSPQCRPLSPQHPPPPSTRHLHPLLCRPVRRAPTVRCNVSTATLASSSACGACGAPPLPAHRALSASRLPRTLSSAAGL
ncbi:hypothetical protein GGH98_005411, partial [Coemansia sp. RSA 454]